VTEAQQQTDNPQFPVVTAEEFDAVDFEGAIRDVQLVDTLPLMQSFMEAAPRATEKGDTAGARVFTLLQALVSMGWDPNDRARIWAPFYTLADGTRSCVPSDFIGDQTAALAVVAPSIKHTPLRARIAIAEHHLQPMVAASGFVPPTQKPIMILGFARFIQGDMMSAAHLVIPQLEPCLRHILKLSGVSPVKRFDDGTEEERDLVGMLKYHRADLKRLLTPNIATEIERLFHVKPGPALRHEFAHGLAGAGDCYGPSAIYGVWLMYRITWLMIGPNWPFVETTLDAIESA
jgi:hypothetical protein